MNKVTVFWLDFPQSKIELEGLTTVMENEHIFSLKPFL